MAEHRVIKNETNSKTIEELRELAVHENGKLLTILNEDLLHEDLIEDLILFDHPLTPLSDSKAPNPSAEFLENISKLQEHVRRKGS